MEQLIASLAPIAAGIGAGVFLRQSICSRSDGQTVAKFASYVTLPSLILQTFSRVSLVELQLPVLIATLVSYTLSAATSWFAYQTRHPRERALLAGSSIGTLQLFALPVSTYLFGPFGTFIVLLCAPINTIANWLVSFGIFSTAGPAFPAAFKHDDGGTYRGEWKGMSKEGYGVYTYASGATYEGEWRAGIKEGRGVYRFPKGGVYEGEWRQGSMAGIGVRTFADGRIKAGVWENGKLVSPLEEWQCALAVEGANEASAVAKRIRVGVSGWGDGFKQLASDPAAWAYIIAAVLAISKIPLTPTVDLVTSSLAPAQAPLSLLALGLTLDIVLPKKAQLRDATGVVAARLIPPLSLAAIGAALLAASGWAIQHIIALIGPALILAISPVSPMVYGYAHTFRLNEKLADDIRCLSILATIAITPLCMAASAVAIAINSMVPVYVCLAGVVATCGSAVVVTRKNDPREPMKQRQDKVRMVYKPPPPSADKPVSTEQQQPSTSDDVDEGRKDAPQALMSHNRRRFAQGGLSVSRRIELLSAKRIDRLRRPHYGSGCRVVQKPLNALRMF